MKFDNNSNTQMLNTIMKDFLESIFNDEILKNLKEANNSPAPAYLPTWSPQDQDKFKMLSQKIKGYAETFNKSSEKLSLNNSAYIDKYNEIMTFLSRKTRLILELEKKIKLSIIYMLQNNAKQKMETAIPTLEKNLEIINIINHIKQISVKIYRNECVKKKLGATSPPEPELPTQKDQSPHPNKLTPAKMGKVRQRLSFYFGRDTNTQSCTNIPYHKYTYDFNQKNEENRITEEILPSEAEKINASLEIRMAGQGVIQDGVIQVNPLFELYLSSISYQLCPVLDQKEAEEKSKESRDEKCIYIYCESRGSNESDKPLKKSTMQWRYLFLDAKNTEHRGELKRSNSNTRIASPIAAPEEKLHTTSDLSESSINSTRFQENSKPSQDTPFSKEEILYQFGENSQNIINQILLETNQQKTQHIYFNKLPLRTKLYLHNTEIGPAEALHAFAKNNPHLVCIHLPVNTGLLHKKYLLSTKTVSLNQIFTDLQKIITKPSINPKNGEVIFSHAAINNNFYIPTSIRSLLFGKNETNYDEKIKKLWNETLSFFQLKENEKPISEKKRTLLLFHFFNYELPQFILQSIQPETFNFSCKDGIDRGGIASSYFRIASEIEAWQHATTEEDKKIHENNIQTEINEVNVAARFAVGRDMNKKATLLELLREIPDIECCIDQPQEQKTTNIQNENNQLNQQPSNSLETNVNTPKQKIKINITELAKPTHHNTSLNKTNTVVSDPSSLPHHRACFFSCDSLQEHLKQFNTKEILAIITAMTGSLITTIGIVGLILSGLSIMMTLTAPIFAIALCLGAMLSLVALCMLLIKACIDHAQNEYDSGQQLC